MTTRTRTTGAHFDYGRSKAPWHGETAQARPSKTLPKQPNRNHEGLKKAGIVAGAVAASAVPVAAVKTKSAVEAKTEQAMSSLETILVHAFALNDTEKLITPHEHAVERPKRRLPDVDFDLDAFTEDERMEPVENTEYEYV